MTIALCILGAAPFAACGFVRYHGLSAEQFLVAWFRSEFLTPERLNCIPENTYAVAILLELEQEQARRIKANRKAWQYNWNHCIEVERYDQNIG